MRELRDYQVEALANIHNEWDHGIIRTVVVHATGLGKTDIIATLATEEAQAGGRVLMLAHRGELLDQMTQRCLLYAPHIPVGRMQANDNETSCAITVASVQTLCHDKRMAQLTDPERPITLLIIDECHHGLAASYLKIMNWAGSFIATRTVGFTATLIRGDHRGFGNVFQSVADERGINWAVKHDWLVQPRGHAVVAESLDVENLTIRHGDYADGELGPVISDAVEAIVKSWQNVAGDRITVAFTPTVAAALALRDGFLASGVAAEAVLGSTERGARAATYQRLSEGITRVLCSVMVTTEGWDCPPVSCVLMARPTRLPGLYQQMMGRGLRLAEGKRDCLVLDVTGIDHRGDTVTLIDMVPSALYDRSEISTAYAKRIEAAQRQRDAEKPAVVRWIRKLLGR